MSSVRIAVVAEFYPRAADPVLGVWAHRQALAAQSAGAEVHVLVLYRPIPPQATPRRALPAATRAMLAQPRDTVLDGLPVTYVRFAAPPRGRSYEQWGRWAQRPLARALDRLHRTFPFDLVHAHNAVPAGDAVRRGGAAGRAPLVISVHGGDVFHTALRSERGAAAVRESLQAAQLVLANSTQIEQRARALGAQRTRVVHLGADVPAHPGAGVGPEATAHGVTLVTIAHLVPRKRHGDVLRAMWSLRDSDPRLRYLIIGDGPQRAELQELAARLELTHRVVFAGQLPHQQALVRAAEEGAVFVMPSTDEALGVAYLEAMAAGLPTIGCTGEPGPEEIAATGEGMLLVPPADVEALAAMIAALTSDRRYRQAVGDGARATVAASFTWEICGAATVAAYEAALGR